MRDAREVGSGPAALAALASSAPSAMLLDIGMPGMNGYELARAIRQLCPTARPTLVALSGCVAKRGTASTPREAGFDLHLVKSAELDALQQPLSAVRPAAPQPG